MGPGDQLQAVSVLGLLLVFMGLILFLLPVIARNLTPDFISKIPPILLWVYQSDGFVFATSPILIVVTIIFVLIRLLRT